MSATNFGITIEQGATFSLRNRITAPNLDLTGATGRAMLKKTYADTSPVASFTVTASNDGTSALIHGLILDMSLTAAQTAALPIPTGTGNTPKLTQWCYDLELVLADGVTVQRLLRGLATISPEITK